MPFDPTGKYNRLYRWTADRDAGINIIADRMDGEFDAIADALTSIVQGAQQFTGAIRGVDGSATAPSFTFASAITTGTFKTSSGGVGVSVGGSTIASFESDGLHIDTIHVTGLVDGRDVSADGATLDTINADYIHKIPSAVVGNIVQVSDANGRSLIDAGISASDIVRAPASAEAGNIALFADATGTILQDSGVQYSGHITPVSNYADLQALKAGTDNVFVAGRTNPGDGGGGMFIWKTGDQSANVSADPLIGIWVPPSSDTTGASGAWMRLVHGGWVRPEFWGAKRDGVTDDGPALKAACNSGYNVELLEGTYYISTPVDLPDFTVAGASWDEDNPFVLKGAGKHKTFIKCAASANEYAIRHPSVNGVTNRGQNGPGVGVYGITFEGTGNILDLTACGGLAISNCRQPRIIDCAFRKFPGLPALKLYAHQSGGIFGGIVRDCYFGRPKWTITAGGKTVYEKTDLETGFCRIAIHLDGPTDTTGKITDAFIQDNVFYDCAIPILSKGHGTAPTDAGTANLTVISNTFGHEGTRKIEDSTLSAVTDASTVTLDTTDYPSTWTATDYAGFVLGVQINGTWEYREISTYDPATRVVTVASAFSAAPSVGASYRVSYWDSDLKGYTQAGQIPSHIVMELGSYHARFIGNRGEEAQCQLVGIDVAASGSARVAMIGNSWRIQDARGPEWNDGTQLVPMEAHELSSTQSASLVSRRIQVEADPQRFRYITALAINNSGGTLTAGRPAGIQTSTAKYLKAAGGGYFPVVVVEDLSGKTKYANGEYVPFALPGSIIPLTIDGTNEFSVANPNDVVYVNTSGQFAISTADFQPKRKVGVVVEYGDDGGTGGNWTCVVMIAP